jgi:hypothetical protein
LTIKFVCSCGKHLRARDEMAARRSLCPRCGAPVGIPSLKPHHAGAAGPMTPMERRRQARFAPAIADEAPSPPPRPPAPPERETQPHEPHPLDSHLVRLLSHRGKRRRHLTTRHLEKSWSACVVYPLRAWRLCLGLTLFLMLCSVSLAASLPALFGGLDVEPMLLGVLQGVAVALAVLLVSLPAGFLDCMLISAVKGEVYYILWSGNPLLTAALGGARWLSCLLAGPVVFAVIGYLYWLNWGIPTPLDWLILAELAVAGACWWIFALLTAAERGWLHGLNPLAVADLAHRLGWRALGWVVLAAVVLLGHGLALVVGVVWAVEEPGGWPILAAGCAGGVFWSTVFCRWLGVCCHRKNQAGVEPIRAGAD